MNKRKIVSALLVTSFLGTTFISSMGTKAWFVDAKTSGATQIETGTLKLTVDGTGVNEVILPLIQPGTSVERAIKIVNAGELSLKYKVSAKNTDGDGYLYNILNVEVQDADGKVLYTGPLNKLQNLSIGNLEWTGASQELKYKVSMPKDVGNYYNSADKNRVYTKMQLVFEATQSDNRGWTEAVTMNNTFNYGEFEAGRANAKAFDGYWQFAKYEDNSGKFETYISPEQIGLNSIKISEIASISYTSQSTDSTNDIYLSIYTEPFINGDASWYGHVLTGEPAYVVNRNITAGWNTFSTKAGNNQFNFFDKHHNGGQLSPNSNKPLTLDKIQIGAVNWSDYYPGKVGSTDYRDQKVKYISLQTGSQSRNVTFSLRDLTITLKDGTTTTINFAK